MIYNKLVRDKIPEIIAQQGKSVSFRALHGDELKKALKDKLIEEVNELVNAETEEQLLEESADVFEIFYRLLIVYGFDFMKCNYVRTKKEMEKGVFKEGYFLESVGDEV